MDSTTLNDLKNRAAVVRDETKRAANTAQRVGSLLYDLADRFGAELMKDNRELLQYESIDKFPTTGTEGIIYMDTTTGYLYRWDNGEWDYQQVGGNNSTGGTVKHCVVAEGVAGSEETLNQLASAELVGKYYILQAKYNAIYCCLSRYIKVGWKVRISYYWREVSDLDALVGDWLTAGWQYYQNGGVMGASTPDETTTYIDDNTGNIYAYNATDGTFSQINNELVELDSTIYVNAVGYSNWLDSASQDLAIYKKEGAYTMVVVSEAKAAQINNNTYNLLVETSSDGSVIRQYLTDRNGYYYRTYQNSKWGAWSNCQYAFKEDLADTNGDTDEIWKYVNWHHAQAKRKHRTTVHYCSSRMKFAMPKVGTTVLIDDAKPHFWGFASFGRMKFPYTKIDWKKNPSNANLYEGVSSIYATVGGKGQHDNDLLKYKVNKSSILFPNWLWDYWLRTDISDDDKGAYFRVKPFDNSDPVLGVYGVSSTGKQNLEATYTLANATGSTGLSARAYFKPTSQTTSEIEISNLASPIVDLCARLTLNDLIAPTPSAHSGNNRYYAIGDIVRFDGTQWQRIDRLATGRSVRVLYQKIEVERTGESAFCYRPQRITLPEFKSFQFKFTSPSQADAQHTVAAPADVLNAYLQYVAKRGGHPAFYQDRHDRTVPRIGTLAIYTKVCTGGKKNSQYKASSVWHRCLPASGFATGDSYYNDNTHATRHHLLCPNTYDNLYVWPKYPWYVDAYIVVVRPVAKFNRTKTGTPDYEPYTQEKPYHRNIEISNRIPVRIAYARKVNSSGTVTTIVRVRQFARI